MANELQGKHVAFLFTEGAEQSEVEGPLEAIRKSGAEVDVISLEKGEVQMWQHFDKGDTIEATKEVSDVSASDYDALVLPGGVVNPDQMRADERAVRFVRDFFEQQKQPDDTTAARSSEAGRRAGGKVVGAICHGPWMLAEADVVKGRTVTSWPSLQTDLRNAGAEWVDREVVVDSGLVTSRKPDDIPAFSAKLVEEIAEGKHEHQRAA